MSEASTGTALRPQELAERALELSTADGCVVIAEEGSEANLRWAGNTLTTNGVTRGRTLTVIATIGGQEGMSTGVVSRSNVGLDRVESIVRDAEAKAREARSAEDVAPLADGDGSDPTWDDPPAETSIDVFGSVAPALGEAFRAARADARATTLPAEHGLAVVRVPRDRGPVLVDEQVGHGTGGQQGLVAPGRQVDPPLRPAQPSPHFGVQRRHVHIGEVAGALADPGRAAPVRGLAGHLDAAGRLVMTATEAGGGR